MTTPSSAASRMLPLSARTKTTTLKQPKELLSYSRDINGETVLDDSMLSYYYFPDSEVDKNYELSKGFKDFKKIDESKDKHGAIQGFLKAIANHERSVWTKLKTDVFSLRGLMTKLLTMQYFPEDPVEYNIVYFDGQVFVRQDLKSAEAAEAEREAQMLSEGRVTKEQMDRYTYAGYKFETLATLPKPWSDCSRKEIENRENKTVNNIEQYLSVVRTGIGSTKLVLGGEVDCVFDYKPSPNDKYNYKDRSNVLAHYAELKTSKVIKHDGQAIQFEKKLFKAWAQCFLLGIPRVFYGFRDDRLYLKNVEEFKTEQIPLLLNNSPFVRHNNNPRLRKVNCADSLKWFGALLEWLVSTIQQSSKEKNIEENDLDTQSRTVYRLSYNHLKQEIALRDLNKTETERILADEPVLTEEFIAWRKELNEIKSAKNQNTE